MYSLFLQKKEMGTYLEHEIHIRDFKKVNKTGITILISLNPKSKFGTRQLKIYLILLN